jgi:hypothetical protein
MGMAPQIKQLNSPYFPILFLVKHDRVSLDYVVYTLPLRFRPEPELGGDFLDRDLVNQNPVKNRGV